MGGAVGIIRLDLTARDLRAAAGREKDGSAARRMLALAMVLDGADRKSATETCDMDRPTLRDWVHRYNAEGLRGLRPAARNGIFGCRDRAPKIITKTLERPQRQKSEN